MDKYLRNWRQDALNKGQHDAAIYIGDKVLALSNSDGDAFWLAQVHFSNNNYTRALAILSKKDLINRSLSCRYLAAHCYIKQGRYEQALILLGEDNPIHLIQSVQHNARRKLAHTNGLGRHITQRGRGERDRIEYSEERERDREQEKELKFQAGMCYLRGLCWSKRNAFDKAKDCFMAAVRIDVQCFEAFDQLMKNSLLTPAEEIQFLNELDFDSIRTEEPAQAQEAAHLTKLLYTTRLSKYSSPQTMTDATETLATHYNLADNPDLMLTQAETLYTQCRFHEALAITTQILNSSSNAEREDLDQNPDVMASLGHAPNLYPLHIACLYETSQHNTLFHLSHTLSLHAPHESYTYLAIATYYLSTARIPEARRFFSKASLMNPHSAEAWIGFAHTFAAEGEHDQAIAAYSTASRLFQGSHLPSLFLGMQHLGLGNMTLAWEYVLHAFSMSSGAGSVSAASSVTASRAKTEEDTNRLNQLVFTQPHALKGDPLVIGELGVILYHQTNLNVAAKLFKRGLELAAQLGCDMSAWVAVRGNLAHALRRMGRYQESLDQFDECLRQLTGGASSILSGLGKNFTSMNLSVDSGAISTGLTAHSVSAGYEQRNLLAAIHTARGLVLLSMMSRTREAVEALHEAVRISGGDAGGGMAGTLLTRAMEVWAAEQDNEDDAEDAFSEDEDDTEQPQHHATSRAGTGRDFQQPGIHADLDMNDLISRKLDKDAENLLDGILMPSYSKYGRQPSEEIPVQSGHNLGRRRAPGEQSFEVEVQEPSQSWSTRARRER
ncbi:anaphase-promoting complex subunit Cut9 [Lithohypha guttulata]|uniref:Anaphase-promoting complex subunit Cut9 n=1 Tax=Lithohypha guttulata TaxID=1690604 RepID=A0AAN7Y7G4_9EURO|nr:anaphase-promoting complex subunit Cut9 [Lithohypha guttulata]